MKKSTCAALALLASLVFVYGDSAGYPRPMSFRSINSKALNAGRYDSMEMVVTDLHTYVRRDAAKQFKKKFPDRLALIQINMERIGLWGSWETVPPQRFEDLGVLDPDVIAREPQFEILADGRYPLPDFPGWWTYDAGGNTLAPIAADSETISVEVEHPAAFRPCDLPRTIKTLKNLVGAESYHKEVVICPRTADGQLDWLNAEMGVITGLDEEASTLTIRRWKTSSPWKAHPAGSYIAPHSVLTYLENTFHRHARRPGDKVLQPWLPNLTEFCPRDPRTGLNAREWLAQWYARFWKEHCRTLDGMVFDVSVGTFYPSQRVSHNADCNNDGAPDAFFFDSINYWPLGVYDFFYTLRNGLPGKFEGVGSECVLLNDSNHNEDQRFFDLLNGGEYENAMNPVWFMPYSFSSMLDRLLLWEARGQGPNRSFVSNKYPDHVYHGGDAADLTGVQTLPHWRMDLAAACMTSGYAGKDITRNADPKKPELSQYPAGEAERKKYRFAAPPLYDEYHAGTATNFNWLGLPVGEAQRITDHLGPELYRFDKKSDPPLVCTRSDWDFTGDWRAGLMDRDGSSFTLGVARVGLWEGEKDSWNCYGDLPLEKVRFEKDAEYTVRFTVKGSNPWKKINPRYAGIPKNIRIRFRVDGIDTVDFGNFSASYIQEALVFEDARECVLTLKAPASGDGSLQIDLSENTGTTTFENLEIREGCGDVLCREFENGLVVLNGSFSSPVRVDLSDLFPGESWSRISGTQDPEHNSGEPVDRHLTIEPHDAFFLRRM